MVRTVTDRTWEEYVDSHEDDVGNEGWVREFDVMVRRIPRKGVRSFLEVGCSAGRWIRRFKERFPGARAYGIDIVRPKRARGFAYRQGDARELPYGDGTFDLVFSLGLVEHFPDVSEKERIIAEQTRTLRKGGYILTTFPTLAVTSLMYWNLKLRNDPKTEFKHYRTTRRQVIALYKRHGIEVVEARYLGWFFEPFGVPRLTRAMPFSQICCVIGRKR